MEKQILYWCAKIHNNIQPAKPFAKEIEGTSLLSLLSLPASRLLPNTAECRSHIPIEENDGGWPNEQSFKTQAAHHLPATEKCADKGRKKRVKKLKKSYICKNKCGNPTLFENK